MIENLLEIARIQSNQIVPTKERVNMRDFIMPFISVYKDAYSTKVSYDIDPSIYMDLDKKITHRIWVWHEFNFPVKLTISAYSDILTISYKNIKFHVNIEDNLFEVPEDIKMQPYTKPD